MYGLSDHLKPIPLTGFRALLQGSSRYSIRIGLCRQYRTDVRTARGRYSPPDTAASDRAEARPLLSRGSNALRHRPRTWRGALGRGGHLAHRDHALPSGPRFFFQAEDGIRDYKVTGVQTCALPI